MGVSGSGKSTLGAALAARLGCEFLDGDDFHPPQNVARMSAGKPLEDADRAPWLARLNAELREREARGASAVLACSALKRSYRASLLHALGSARLVHLEGSRALIESRLAVRAHRYMPASLLASQFATLEPPQPGDGALRIDVSATPPECVQAMLEGLGLGLGTGAAQPRTDLAQRGSSA